MAVKPVPEGYHSVIPYLVMKNAARAIDFYTKAFGAKELFRMPTPDGKIGHAELLIGDAHVMLADEQPEMDAFGPDKFGGSPVMIMVYIPDVDAAVNRAVEGGATLTRPVKDQFYGDRSGVIRDPFGHMWNVATHIEDVTPEEMERRMSAMQGA